MGESILRSFQGFIFDLDGVLVDSYYCWFYLLQDAMREQGKTPVTLEEFDASWGQGVEADIDVFFPEWTIEYLITFYEQRFPEYTRWAKLEPGSEMLLKHLRQSEKKIAVASNSPTQVVKDLLTTAGLQQYPDVVIGAEQVRESKPAPDLILKAMKDLSMTKERVCYIGDSIYDAQAAEAAAIFFVGYKRPGGISVQNFEELIRLL